MKALFCYDGPLYKDVDGNYYDSILNNQMFERYFKVASELEIIIRTRPIDAGYGRNNMDKLSDQRISVVDCPNLSSISGLMRGQSEVRKILRDRIQNADLIFIRLPSVIGNLAVDVCRQQKRDYLVEVVGCPWDSYWNYSLKGKLLAPMAKAMMKNRVKHAPFVLYVTNEFLQKRYPTKGKSINCSNVELRETDVEVLENRFKRIDSYGENTKYIIGTAAGLDVLYKGQQYVIKALSVLRQRGISNFEYQLIGGGTGAYLMQLAEKLGVAEQLRIVGQLPHERVFDWLDSTDIYIQPSRQEGLPRSVIEAMSRGILCIGARTAGIPELLDPHMVFDNGRHEAEEIAEILLSVSLSPEKKNMAKRNFEEAQKYKRSKLVSKRTAFFQEYASQKR